MDSRGDPGSRVQRKRLRESTTVGQLERSAAAAAAAAAVTGARAAQPKLWQSSVLITISLLILTLGSQCAYGLLIEKWTVGIWGGMDEANRVASEIGCKNLGLVTGFNDVYLFEKPSGRRKQQQSNQVINPELEQKGDDDDDDESHVHRTKRQLEGHPSVAWVDPQTPHTRVKRDLLPIPKQQQPASVLASSGHGPQHQNQNQNKNPNQNKQAFEKLTSGSVAPSKRPFNDELWTHQWYLQDNSNVALYQSDVDLKVQDVWSMGFYGQGVVVTILDDGLEYNHTDIKQNYDPLASWDMNNNKADPFPRYDSRNYNSHGTRCAGEVAMVADNKKCGVGVAPRARIGGIKCLDGEVADHVESMSLLHNLQHIDIYSGSWGPKDDGRLVEGPKRLTKDALEKGIKEGRQGKGALYIWANGNGGAEGDNCNCDGYVTSIYTISVGGVTQQGQMPFYGERCSSTLAVTCSSGAYTDRKIVTTDLHNKCTIDYTGSSAAAPLAAGIYALALEANSNLTWRDVQHLTAWTSNPLPIRDNPGWKRNAAGFMFNNRFGFGLMNAKAMVEAALTWPTVPKKSICIVSSTSSLPAYLHSRGMAQVFFVTDGCQREFENQQQQQFHLQQQQQQQQQAAGRLLMKPGQHQHQQQPPFHAIPGSSGRLQQRSDSRPTPVIYLEHVQVIVDIEYSSRGELDIFLVSPAGTVSTLLSRRPLDVSRNGFDQWPLMSVHFWGESSQGRWTLMVRDKDSQNNRGLLRNATLVLHGTSVRPAHMQRPRVYEGESQVPSFIDPVQEFDEDDIYDLNNFPNEMSLARDDSYQPNFIKSVIASEKSNTRRERPL